MAKKPDNGAVERHKHKPLGLRPDSRYMTAMRELASRNRRTITAELEIAMEEHLAKAGLWPPKK